MNRTYMIHLPPGLSFWDPPEESPAPAACPVSYRLSTERYPGFAGVAGYLVNDRTLEFKTTGMSISTPIESPYVIATVQHDFPDTGCARSWCDHCGAVGHWEWHLGTHT